MTTNNWRYPLRLAAGLVLAAAIFPGSALATTGPTDLPNSLRWKATNGATRAVIVRVDEILNSITSTVYSWANDWDETTGVYAVNCTQYLDRVLEDVAPVAFDELAASCGCARPRSKDYLEYFAAIPPGETDGHWLHVATVADARAGDFFAEKYDASSTSTSTGHTMLLVSLPRPEPDMPNVYRVRISDAAKSGHTNDSRTGTDSGLGAGEILIKVDTDGAPIGYKWRVSSTSWHTGELAIGRPLP